MEALELMEVLGERTNGDCYLGVVGPVRVGKSTFIRRFMEAVVLKHISDPEEKREQLTNCHKQVLENYHYNGAKICTSKRCHIKN